jgi:cell fate regulator YaaT (PSP1 superfamily)
MSEDGINKENSYLPRAWGHEWRDKKRSRASDGCRDADPPELEAGDLLSSEPDVAYIASDEDVESLAGSDVNAPASPNRDRRVCRRPCPCGDSPAALTDDRLEALDEDSIPEMQRVSPKVQVCIVGVRFARAGKIYHFEAGDLELVQGDWVIVKTEKGMGLGQVAIAPWQTEIEESQRDILRAVIRKAGRADFEQKNRCAQREIEARAYCLERIEALGLPMKLVSVECFYDGSKYVFYFTAEGRVDFRELVKQLVARFPVRIEMRQIGVRHEAKMTGGIASCGQELCCCRFLTDFRPVSVKMAKTQNLSLNPTKISGVCGRLMCCLGYEHDTYENFKQGLPKVGKTVKTKRGEGIVVKYHPLKETICIRMEDDTLVDVTRDEVVEHGNAPRREREGKKKAPEKQTSSGGAPEREEAPEKT